MSGARTQVGIVEWARRARSARTLERQIAAVLGDAIPGAMQPGVKLLLARHARHFAWHGDLWDGLVPTLHDVSVDDPPRPLADVEDVHVENVYFANVYVEVVPRLTATYRAWGVEATPVAERPVLRVLDLVLRDLDFDAGEAQRLLGAR
ncbi:MAG TPA: hypothetical protein VGA11_01135 [Acidimicrobiia bacterium]